MISQSNIQPLTLFSSPTFSKPHLITPSDTNLSFLSTSNPSLLSTEASRSGSCTAINPRLPDFPFNPNSKPLTYTSPPLRDHCVDRFIPLRSDPTKRKLLFDLHEDDDSEMCEETAPSHQNQQSINYRMLLEEQVLGLPRSVFHDDFTYGSIHKYKSPNRLLKFKKQNREDKISSPNILHPSCFPFSSENMEARPPAPVLRKVPEKPCRVLEAPYLEDDYYLNLLEWSNSNNVAVALRDTIYLWSGEEGTINRLCQMEGDSELYTSVGWDPRGDKLATGISNGKLEIWDVNRGVVVRDDLEPHYGRIGCLSWGENNLLASGSMDSMIQLRDMRIRGPESTVMRLEGHKYEVCGLKWSPNSVQLASGGNDNKLFIWNVKKGSSEAKFGDHKAAVKALTWSPHQNGLLLSGGGNNDKTIKFWNTLTMKNVRSVYTASQVCNLMFSKNSNEFVSTHGFNNNHVVIWKYPELSKVSILEGHTSRVLYLGLSPDGETIVTGAGASDETLRFWNAFPRVRDNNSSLLMPGSNNLR